MTPDATRHDPRPDYLRALLERAGLSQRAAARQIGIDERSMRYYLADPAGPSRYTPAPYPVQYALEALARQAASAGSFAEQAARLVEQTDRLRLPAERTKSPTPDRGARR
jgi:hypothetical protein